MTSGHGFKAKYDYLEILVEKEGDQWLLTLDDRKHDERVTHERRFNSSQEAQREALAFAENHISVKHNDTLLQSRRVMWSEY